MIPKGGEQKERSRVDIPLDFPPFPFDVSWGLFTARLLLIQTVT